MRPHTHPIAGVRGVEGLITMGPGEFDATYNVDGTILKAEIKRPDGTLAEVWVFAYNAGPVPPAKTLHTATHQSYQTDGFTPYGAAVVYIVTYNTGPVPPAGTVRNIVAS